MRNIQSFKTKTPNSLSKWHKIKSPLTVVFNYIIISFCRVCPSLALKRFLLRLTGMKIGKNVSIGLHAMFDIFWPELITIRDNTILGYNSTIICHEFLINEYRIGKVVVGKNVVIGANSTILAGITIGDNSIISAMSLVNKNIPENVLAGGIPAKPIKRISE